MIASLAGGGIAEPTGGFQYPDLDTIIRGLESPESMFCLAKLVSAPIIQTGGLLGRPSIVFARERPSL